MHTFHIPVLGIGYTIDTPLKVAHLGIDSVISLVDDILIEKIRKMYCEKFGVPYHEISDKMEDFRARRITSYLNMIQCQVEKKLTELKTSALEKGNELKELFGLLPDTSSIKQEFFGSVSRFFNFQEIKQWLNENLTMGSIDVNIMTKIDKDNYKNGIKLDHAFNDAHAAVRGFAQSNLSSTLILSAGMNPRLYSYLEQFDDFYPDENGVIKKKIALKVSDFRSAMIQGKFLAKKGIWVSEFRIESGLNCGGHAFATDGHLLGPILQDFRTSREQLASENYDLLIKALKEKDKPVPGKILPIKITAQGGVGTAEEHQFLIDHYQLDSIGWGSPFLLVPEAASIDDQTIDQLANASEKDLYLSHISPLGVPFNSLRGNTKDIEKLSLAFNGKPGSSCPKKYVANNDEFTERSICTASRHYQRQKIKALDKENLEPEAYKNRWQSIVEKACICVGLGTSSLLVNNLETNSEGVGVSVCPGPNMAYFSRKMTLSELVDHIYGRGNVIVRNDRPNLFNKELNLYIAYLKNKMDEAKLNLTKKQEVYFETFGNNLKEGIKYYQSLFGAAKDKFQDTKEDVLRELEISLKQLEKLMGRS